MKKGGGRRVSVREGGMRERCRQNSYRYRGKRGEGGGAGWEAESDETIVVNYL